MSTHNICFNGEIRKNINTFWLKKVSNLELVIVDSHSELIYDKLVLLLWTNILKSGVINLL